MGRDGLGVLVEIDYFALVLLLLHVGVYQLAFLGLEDCYFLGDVRDLRGLGD